MKRRFALCRGKILITEGPYTQAEIRARITEIFGSDWYWSSEMSDGSFLATSHGTSEILAEAVPE